MTRSEVMQLAAQWLEDETESHAIYRDRALESLPRRTGGNVKFDAEACELRYGDRVVAAPIHTSAWFRAAIKKRGLGGELEEGDWLGFSGYEIAVALADLFEVPLNGKLSGRGFIWRDALKRLRDAAGSAAN
jgi:hypothetical protein